MGLDAARGQNPVAEMMGLTLWASITLVFDGQPLHQVGLHILMGCIEMGNS